MRGELGFMAPDEKFRDAGRKTARVRSYLRGTQRRSNIVKRHFQSEPVRCAVNGPASSGRGSIVIHGFWRVGALSTRDARAD